MVAESVSSAPRCLGEQHRVSPVAVQALSGSVPQAALCCSPLVPQDWHPARSALCSMLGSGSSHRTLSPSFSPNVNAHNPLCTALPLKQGENREAVLCTPCYTCPRFSRRNEKALLFVPGLGRASRSTGARAILPRQHEGYCLAAARFANPPPAPPVALLGCPLVAAAAAVLPLHPCEDVSDGLLQPLS